jgi:dienelactone hydrolase
VATFAEALDAAKIPHRTETHADGGHGYMFAERFRADLPGQPAYSAYSPIAAEDTWDRLFDLWERRLGQVD